MKVLLKRLGWGALAYVLLGVPAFVILSLLGIEFETVLNILGLIYIAIVSIIIYESI